MSTTQAPKWYMPIAIVALLWNLAGCAAYLSDVTLSADDVAAMTEAQQALYSARPAWAVAGTALAVWCGAAGCLGLILRKAWAVPVLAASLAGVVIQDLGFLVVDGSLVGSTAVALQGLVLVVAVGLVLLGRKASAEAWIA